MQSSNLIQWEYKNNWWTATDIVKPNEHFHYLNLGEIRWYMAGVAPINPSDINTKWMSIQIHN